MPEVEVIKFSSGFFFYKTARIKRIPCDQLKPLHVHKERGKSNMERRMVVIRRLYKDGGWVRIGKYKTKRYVEAGTPLPDCYRIKKFRNFMNTYTKILVNS